MFRRKVTDFFCQIDMVSIRVQTYLKRNIYLVALLIIATLAAYGFELFNFNITPDEEIHATYLGHTRAWIVQGRWGMYLLNKFIIPYTTIPFIPLFIGLLFYIAAVLLLLKSWNITSVLDQIVFGAICITFPTMSFMYTFSTINYGVGIGVFFVALAMFIYSTARGYNKLFSLLPAAFSIGVYQSFIFVLIAAFTVYIILDVIRTQRIVVKNLLVIFLINVSALVLYFVVQRIFNSSTGNNTANSYVESFFAWQDLLNGNKLVEIFHRIIFEQAIPVYMGDKSIYALSAGAFGGLLLIGMLSLIFNLYSSRFSFVNSLFVVLLSFFLLLVPFLGAFFIKVTLMRFLIAVPLAAAGFVMIGIFGSHRGYKVLVTMITAYCVLQFSLVTNHLFAASHLALQADRILAANLVDRINEAQSQAGVKKIRFIEIVGYYDEPETQLIPKRETFGSSFFEFGQGDNERIVMFLQTLRIGGLMPMPNDRRDDKFFNFVDTMPEWPQDGSVKVFRNDIVVIKFSPYSHLQRTLLCQSPQIQALSHYEELCR